MAMPVTEVAVCIVTASDNRVLLAERTGRQVGAGFWELPGGKIEIGEAPMQAAARELREETGLAATGLAPWMTYEHHFPSKSLRLHFFRAAGWTGTPVGREGQRLAWVDPYSPHIGPILASNDRALFALTLPAVYHVADYGTGDTQDGFLIGLRTMLTEGATMLRVRLSGVSPGQTGSLLGRIGALARSFPGASILAASSMQAHCGGIAGVHSTAQELRRLGGRPAVRVWGATCHTEADLARAAAFGADFAVLSPIMQDPKRPAQNVLGWDVLRRCTAAYPMRIYAHGGLSADDAIAVQRAGAAGLMLERMPARTERSDSREAWQARRMRA